MNENSQTHARLDRMTDIAFGIVETVNRGIEEGVPADKTLAKVFRENRQYGSRDRRFYSDTVFAHLRWLGWTQRAANEPKQRIALGVLLDDTVAEKTRAIWALACGLEDCPLNPLRETGLQAKADALAGWASIEPPSPEQLLPEWTANVIAPRERLTRFAESCQLRPPTWIHIPDSWKNAFEPFLEKRGIEYRAHDVLTNAYALLTPFQLPELEKAWGNAIQIQDLASQAVVAACGARDGESWRDTCCGSGGKSLGLAAACGAAGSVLATDVRISILRNLKKRAKAHRFKKIQTLLADVTSDSPGPRKFDGVLVDAPCSGLGTWPRNPDARWRTVAEAIERIAQTQADILANASRQVKPGGTLVYSICTLTENEGPGVVKPFLEQHPSFELSPVLHPFSGEETSGEIQIMPDEGPCDGMYIVVMKNRLE